MDNSIANLQRPGNWLTAWQLATGNWLNGNGHGDGHGHGHGNGYGFSTTESTEYTDVETETTRA